MLSDRKRQGVLNNLISSLSTTGKYGAKVVSYATALGAIALIGGAQLPPELQVLVGGVGVNILSNLIDRGAKYDISKEQIQEQVELAIRLSNIDDLLTEDRFSRSLSILIRNQMKILGGVEGNRIETEQINNRLNKLIHELQFEHINLPTELINPFELSIFDSKVLDGEAGEIFLTSSLSTISLSNIVKDKQNPPIDRLGILIIDVDGLTKINKFHGDEIGNSVLKSIASTLLYYSKFPYTGRCGDDTFYLILPNYDPKATLSRGESLRKVIQNMAWTSLCAGLWVTCSIGASIWEPRETLPEAIARAAQGMQQAKRIGGNRVTMGPEHLSKQERENLRAKQQIRSTYYS